MSGNKKKLILGTVAITMAFAVFSTSCKKTEENEIPAYDASTRVATDQSEQVVTLDSENYSYYNNSIELYDDDGNVYDIGDPYVFRYDGKYYLYSSLNGERRYNGQIPCWVSDNLVDWEFAAYAYTPDYVATDSPSYIAFAPEVVYYKGYFYLCESRRGQGHYFFRSESPIGPFELISDNLHMGLDGSFYLANDGQLYFMSAEDEYTDRICYYKIDFVEDEEGTPSVEIDTTKRTIVDTAELGGWTEGPGYFARNGYQYLTYTGNHVDSANYRVGYSSTSDSLLFNGLTKKADNITLIASGMDTPSVDAYTYVNGESTTVAARSSNFRGLGHSSNVIGPNMDSIYTAFHNADRINYDNTFYTSTRQYNLTQYYTNNSYVLTNGLGNYLKTKPEMPDYTAAASELTETENGTYMSTKETEKVFTAELSFKLTDNAGKVLLGQGNGNGASVTVSGTKLTYTASDGSTAVGTVAISTNGNAVHTVKVVNGYASVEIYYDNVRVVTSGKPANAGKVGYTGGAIPSSTCFTNDAFGTSDFDSVKDLTGSWAAYAYMKGENVGYSLSDASVRTDGVRQGEAEKTAYVEKIDATALTLTANDWVKYTVNAPKSDWYSLSLLVGEESKGCIFEVIIDNESIYKMQIPSDLSFGDDGYVNINAGSFECESGLHTMKIRVYGGKLNVVNVSTESGAKSLGELSDALTDGEQSVFKGLVGTRYSYMPNMGLLTSAKDDRTLLIAGSQGVSNYEISVNVKIAQGSSGGIMFRLDNYSFTNYKTTQLSDSWRGYYLQLNPTSISLKRGDYTTSPESIKTVKTTGDDALKDGTTVKVTIRCLYNDITISINGEKYIEYHDENAYTTGYIGLYADSSSYLYSSFTYKEI